MDVLKQCLMLILDVYSGSTSMLGSSQFSESSKACGIKCLPPILNSGFLRSKPLTSWLSANSAEFSPQIPSEPRLLAASPVQSLVAWAETDDGRNTPNKKTTG